MDTPSRWIRPEVRRSPLRSAPRTLVAVVMHAVCSGCVGEQTASLSVPPGVVIADSAGIKEVRHSGEPRALEAWVVSSEHVARVGEVEGAPSELFAGVAGGALLGDGGFVVADRESRELRYFDSTGAHRRSVGGAGQGPRELVHLRFLGRIGNDTVVIADPVARKVLLFDGNGEFVRTSYLPAEYALPFPVAVTGLGVVSLERTQESPRPGPEGIARSAFNVLVSGWHSGHVWTVGPVPGQEWTEAEGVSGKIPFGRDMFVAASDDHVVLATNDEYRVRVYAADGVLAHVISWDLTPVAPIEGDLEAFMSQELAPYGDEEFRERAMRWAQAVPARGTTPAFSTIVATRDGNVWVRDGRRPSGPTAHWTVFDRGGRAVATVALPPDVVLLDATAELVLLAGRDGLGVEFVGMHSIARTGSPVNAGQP